MTVANNTNTKLIEKYRLHPKDKGSTEVQVAIISNRISSLTEHLKVNKKIKAAYTDCTNWLVEEKDFEIFKIPKSRKNIFR